ncbi:Protein of unknown function [Gryllus bimaculatus]|nr:Protein of unknown function [Gryllus bimaculatus]
MDSSDYKGAITYNTENQHDQAPVSNGLLRRCDKRNAARTFLCSIEEFANVHLDEVDMNNAVVVLHVNTQPHSVQSARSRCVGGGSVEEEEEEEKPRPPFAGPTTRGAPACVGGVGVGSVA